MAKTKKKAEYGDFQTPLALARVATDVLLKTGLEPKTIIEPTCGKGRFLVAAMEAFPQADALLGFEINPGYVEEARQAITSPKATIQCKDFFATDWPTILNRLPEPILFIGNPPWVTNAELGALGSSNLPEKSNFQGLAGFDAKTGKSNFDISEWMLVKLLELLEGRNAALAMLCKTAVARKVLLHAWKNGWGVSRAEIHLIDAAKHFDAAVDACFLICHFSQTETVSECSVFARLGMPATGPSFGFREGKLIADIQAFEKWRHLQGEGLYRWRSGVKHDCSKVMEFTEKEGVLVNGMGNEVELERDYLYPLLKSSELAGGRTEKPTRMMLVTQQSVGQETDEIESKAPQTWSYLQTHAGLLRRRRSSIYKNRPQFSIFGIGDYSFAPYKVAISGFYKKLQFVVCGRHEHKPIMLDDTAYFIPCKTAAEAEFVAKMLNSQVAREFFSAFIFWDSKRPITVAVLRLLGIEALAKELGCECELASFHGNRQLQLW